MGARTQDNRFIAIDTPLGKDVLLLASLNGIDTLSEVSTYQAMALSAEDWIDPSRILGQAVTCTIRGAQERVVHAHVVALERGEVAGDGLREYRLQLAAWPWFLGKRTDNRVFQNKTAIEIVSEVCRNLGFSDLDTGGVRGNPPKREYCVQFGESDLEFVTRLLAEEGVAFYFRHESTRHVMVLTDRPDGWPDAVPGELAYSRAPAPEPRFSTWRRLGRVVSGNYHVDDYDPLKPGARFEATVATQARWPGAERYDIYDYPAFAADPAVARRRLESRRDAGDASHDTVLASSDAPGFHAGAVFRLSAHERKEEKGKYLVTRVSHRAWDRSYLSGQEGDAGYANEIAAIPATTPWRPGQGAVKPVMRGPQSAVVTGPKGEEIHVDEHGRVKVQFHWDRDGKRDENTTCWVRVMQAWAGNKWGTQFIPRIGQEVIVDFLDGDPDRPIITGAVYNGDNRPPFATRTQSGIKTQSSKGAAAENYNELRFEDKKGGEEIHLQAEKDFTRLVKNDEAAEIQASQTTIVKKDQKTTVEGSHVLSVTKDSNTDAKTIVIKANQSIELKVGGSKIVMDASGIQIKGTKVEVNGTLSEVKGSGMVTVKGGITRIN